ncbi:MAG: hypothetical protein K9G44_10935 [Melioribacteraceae bacterium]|nr:hypothetical protein [Melioribacteraceae bacterium]
MKIKFIYLLCLLPAIILSQRVVNPNDYRSNYVLQKKLDNLHRIRIDNINFALQGNLSDQELKGIIKEIGLNLIHTDSSKALIEKCISDFFQFDYGTQKEILFAANSVFRNEFEKEIKNLFEKLNDPLLFIISTEYLAKIDSLNLGYIKREFASRTQKFSSNPIVKKYFGDLEKEKQSLPNLNDLLSHPFQENQTIIFSFFRENREFPGLSIIRNPDGSFVLDSNGNILSIQQLALSVTDLPGYISNGNTPEGIYTIEGWYITPTEVIGPSPIILTRIPFEVSPQKFFHNQSIAKNWNLDLYRDFLPESWRTYEPIFESYYAGMFGRRLIIMHGSADDPRYYIDQAFFPLTPSRGCITSKEIWNHDNGTIVESDQIKLANAFFSTKVEKGYLIVINLNDKNTKVELSEILKFLPNVGK